MNQQTKYKTINLNQDACNQLVKLAEHLSNEYATVTLGNLVSQLVNEKLNTFTPKK